MSEHTNGHTNGQIGVTTEFILAAVPALLAEIIKQRSAMRDVTSKSLSAFMRSTTKELLEECSRKDDPPTPMQCLKIDLEDVVEKFFAEVRETVKYELRIEMMMELESMVNARIAQLGTGTLAAGGSAAVCTHATSGARKQVVSRSDAGSHTPRKESLIGKEIAAAAPTTRVATNTVPAGRTEVIASIRAAIRPPEETITIQPDFSTQIETTHDSCDLSKNPLYERVCKNLDRMSQGKPAYDVEELINARGPRFDAEEAGKFRDRAEHLNDFDEDEGNNDIWDKLIKMREGQ